MSARSVSEITNALQEIRTVVTQSMGKNRSVEQKMRDALADIQGMNNIIKEKEAGIRQKEVEIQKFRQMIMETKSLIPRKENDLKKLQADHAQIKRDFDDHQRKISELERELGEAQHVRPHSGDEPEHHHF